MKEYYENVLGFKVQTPYGWKDFTGIAMMGRKPLVNIVLSNGMSLSCTDGHRLLHEELGVKMVSDLSIGDSVLCRDGTASSIVSKTHTGSTAPVYDLIDVDGGHLYHTGGFVSHNCEFVTDDETLINPLKLQKMKFIEPQFYTENVRWFVEQLEPNKTYLVGLDPSAGVGKDSAAIQIFQLPEMIQVGEWEHNETSPRNQVKQLMQILVFIDAVLRDDPDQESDPDIMWTVENNGLGEAILTVIEDTGEDRFPGIFISERKKKGSVKKFRKGFFTSNTRKVAAAARFKSLIESDRAIVNSEQLLYQLKQYVSRGSGFGGKPGEKDDLVSGCLLVVRMLDIALSWMEDTGDLKEHIGDDELYGEPLPVVI